MFDPRDRVGFLILSIRLLVVSLFILKHITNSGPLVTRVDVGHYYPDAPLASRERRGLSDTALVWYYCTLD